MRAVGIFSVPGLPRACIAETNNFADCVCRYYHDNLVAILLFGGRRALPLLAGMLWVVTLF